MVSFHVTEKKSAEILTKSNLEEYMKDKEKLSEKQSAIIIE